MLERVLEVLRHSRVDRTVVVLGAHVADVRSAVKFQDEEVVLNPDYESGLASSMNVGLTAAVKMGADATLIMLGDQPRVSSKTIDALIKAYMSSRAMVVAPVYHGRRGNPVIFDKELFPRIMRIRGDVGAKAVVEESKEHLLEVAVDDEGVIVDIDTPSDQQRAS
jgi:molybdenum cofactor cytidylyltransferase